MGLDHRYIHGKNTLALIKETNKLPVDDAWISKTQLDAAFVFAPTFYENTGEVSVNHLGTHLIYNYYHDAWKIEDGIFFIVPDS